MSEGEAPFITNFGTRWMLGHLHTPAAVQMGKCSLLSVEMETVVAPESLEYRKTSYLC
jgi:hypothetical protein